MVDGRPGPSLGTRGGLYADTSTLTVRSEDVVPKLQAQAETAVRLLGYTPSANAYNAPQLTLTLAELKYQSPKDGVYVTQADITATFRADVQNSSRRYTGRYGASLNQRFGMSKAYGVQVASQIGALAGLGQESLQLANTGVDYLMTLPNSRANENEADLIGLELAARAGYNPEAAITLWQKMGRASGGASQPEFTSTHPSDSSRMANLQAAIPKVMPLYQQARRGK